MTIYFIPTFLHAQSDGPLDRDYVVKYLSVDLVYLDGGKLDGLKKGDQFIVSRGDSVIAILEIRYVSNTSASCIITESSGHIFANDVAILYRRAPGEVAAADTTATDTSRVLQAPITASSTTTTPKRPSARLAGTASVQFYSWLDESPSDLDYLQTTLRLNLRLRQINGGGFFATVRTRGEYENRTRSYSASSPAEDWSNRIHELSFGYDDSDSPYNFQIGRVLPRRLSGAGYIDGGLLERRLSSSARIGVFGGLRPRWQYQEQAVSLHKYGTYLTLSHKHDSHLIVEQSLAVSGEYHSSTVSRELLYLQGQVSVDSKWFASHIVEMDINRGWRRAKENSSFTLSNVYLNTRYRFSRSVSFGVSYDNRRSYWSYETRTVADSLFDDQLRSGLRGQLNLLLPSDVSIYANTGYRKRAEDPSSTISYSTSITKGKIPFAGSSINLRFATFNGPTSDGSNYGVRLSQYIRGSNSMEIGYSEYRYTSLSGSGTRSNRTWDAMLYLSLVRHLFLIGSCQLDRGDDTRGTAIRGELGYRM